MKNHGNIGRRRHHSKMKRIVDVVVDLASKGGPTDKSITTRDVMARVAGAVHGPRQNLMTD